MIGVCSNDTPQFCDRSCKTDQECKFACGCGCISRDEKCSSNAVCKIGVCHTCRCINGKCESWFDVFKRALDTKDVALCGKIKPISCKDTCYKILAIDTKNITLCDEISNVYGRTTCRDVIKQEQVTITTDKTEYEQGETVEITVRNNLVESIWYREWDTKCSGTSFSIGKKRDNRYSFYPLGLAECVMDEVELKPKATRIYALNLNEWKKTKFPHTDIDTGVYKWRFIYILKNGDKESKRSTPMNSRLKRK